MLPKIIQGFLKQAAYKFVGGEIVISFRPCHQIMLQIIYNNREFTIQSDLSGLNAISDPVYAQVAKLISWTMVKWLQISPDASMRVALAKDTNLSYKSYRITCNGSNSYEIRWNALAPPREDIHHNYAAFAAAALCEKIYGAVMIMPGRTGLHVNINRPEKMVSGQSFAYVSKLQFHCWSNINVSGDEQAFFHWHHIPSEGFNNTGLRGRYLDQFLPFLPNIGLPFNIKQYTLYFPGPGNSGADPFSPIPLYCETFKIGETLYEDNLLNRFFKPPSGIMYLNGPSDLFYPVSVSSKGVILSFPTIVPAGISELPESIFPFTPLESYRCTSPQNSYAENWANTFPIMVTPPAPGGELPSTQKLDIFKEYDDPESENIVADNLYRQWLFQGRPDLVNLFEQDGSDFKNITPLFFADIPNRFKAVEINGLVYDITQDPEFVKVISNSIHYGAPAGFNFSWTTNPHKHKWWRENFYDLFEIQNNTCPNPRDYKFWLNMGSVTNDNSWQANKIVLTRYYLKWYKIVETLFESRCIAEGYPVPRFRVLAYSNYYTFPKDVNIDLSRFEVWFSSPAISDKSEGRVALDIANWSRWSASGAQMIWRPNIFFSWRALPFLDYFHWWPFLQHTMPDMRGLIVEGFTPSNASGLQAMNIYALARGVRGAGRKECLEEFTGCFGTKKEAVNIFINAMIQATAAVIIFPQGKRANRMPLNRLLHNHLKIGLKAGGVNLSMPSGFGEKYLSFCMHLWEQFLNYQDEVNIADRAQIKSGIILWIRNFLNNNPDCQCFSPAVGNTTRLISAYGVTRQNEDGTWLEEGLMVNGLNVPLNTQPPSIAFQTPGVPVLMASPGTWQSADTITYQYQWRRNGLNIATANQQTYTPNPGDVGLTIDCFIRAINKWGDYFAETNGILIRQNDI